MKTTPSVLFSFVKWLFGDGDSSNVWAPSHQYHAAGNFDVSLTVFDTVAKCQKTFYNYIYVDVIDTGTLCKANFNFFIDKDTVFFNNSSFGSFTQTVWNFGDGNFSNDFNPVHFYQNPGYYFVNLTISDSASGCYDYYEKDVFIKDPIGTGCFASFGFNLEGNTVHFNDQSSMNITHWNWDFGDGTYSNLKHPDHTYATGGYYYVNLNVLDSVSGCSNNFFNNIFIEDSASGGCFAKFSFFTDSNVVNFSDQSGGNITNWYWDFGDGKFANVKTPCTPTRPRA
ncbi:MAG: PKD domain-containing protein, partial [Bacteroidales bacterium]|nr:PKD domain-containing protein [Bacteroidales bacterium]